MRRWMAHYGEIGIEAITGTMVMLRKRRNGQGGGGRRRAVSIARVPQRITGDAFARVFDAQDRVASLADGALLDVPLRAAAGLSVERYERGGEGKSSVVLDCELALGVRRPVEPALADLVQALDGGRSAREAGADESLGPGLAGLVKLGFVVFA
jgi:hypothetical protein